MKQNNNNNNNNNKRIKKTFFYITLMKTLFYSILKWRVKSCHMKKYTK